MKAFRAMCLVMLVVALLSHFSLPVTAQAPAALDDPAELEAFLDGQMEAYMRTDHVAGAVITVVKDGEVFFSKGYGLADVEQALPVSPDTTLFRPGSVSKLFTWTAVMQLVEQGRLDLDADVNTYLSAFQIPATFPEPIRLRHLLTHTPGFEDVGEGLFLREGSPTLSLEEYLVTYMPARVYPPGQIAAYSNYGSALAGYIVSEVAGMPFEQYVEENIFRPLGMERSTFVQPPPAPLAQDVSRGYRYRNGAFEERWFEVVQAPPAGGLSATAADMARFMIAYLQGGQLGDVRILEEDTVRQMQELHFSHDPRLMGWGWGFAVEQEKGLKAVGHGGDTTYFHSFLGLLPEHNVGIFISTNSQTGSNLRAGVFEGIVQRYFLEPASPQPVASYSPDDGNRFSGAYLPARSNYTRFEKLLGLFQVLNVSTTERGTIRLIGPYAQDDLEWAPAEALTFRPTDPQSRRGPVIFSEDGSRLHFGPWAFLRLPWYGTPPFQYAVLGASLAALASAVVAWPVGFLGNRRRRLELGSPGEPGLARAGRLLAWTSALLTLVSLGATAAVLSDFESVTFGMPPALNALLTVPYLTSVLAIGVAVFAVLAWVKGWWTLIGRLHYTLIAAAGLALVWWYAYWNVIL
ncbi:MAG: serine hydrolase domain-containing protein [Anaerolineae bacterium]|jgi:CubicO group peptidase (beta-lactamase class C family)